MRTYTHDASTGVFLIHSSPEKLRILCVLLGVLYGPDDPARYASFILCERCIKGFICGSGKWKLGTRDMLGSSDVSLSGLIWRTVLAYVMRSTRSPYDAGLPGLNLRLLLCFDGLSLCFWLQSLGELFCITAIVVPASEVVQKNSGLGIRTTSKLKLVFVLEVSFRVEMGQQVGKVGEGFGGRAEAADERLTAILGSLRHGCMDCL